MSRFFNESKNDHNHTFINESDGRTFYGYDDGNGSTIWYDEDGACDSISSTPTDDDEW